MLSIPWVFVVTASCNGGNHAHHLNDDWNWTSLRKSSTAKRLHSMHRYHTHGCHNSCCSRLYTKSAFWLMYADFDYVLYTSFTREAWHHADFNILSRFGKHSLKIGVSYCNHSLHCAQLNLLFFDHTHDIQSVWPTWYFTIPKQKTFLPPQLSLEWNCCNVGMDPV